jgi:hypothetical protein
VLINGFLLVDQSILETPTHITDFFSIADAELSARPTWIPKIDSLEFINNPVEVGTYQVKHPDQLGRPNIGLYALRLTPKNQFYLEHENRLCDILDTLESMESSDAKEDMEDRGLARVGQDKSLERGRMVESAE